MLQARAKERDASEQAAYAAKIQERVEKARQSRRTPRTRPPKPPRPRPREKDQYNVTDPQSPIMKHSSSEGFEQVYTVQVAVEPVKGMIKEVLGFRQFSLRGERAASGE